MSRNQSKSGNTRVLLTSVHERNSFHLSQIQPLLLIGRLQLLQLMCSVVDVWFRQVMALQVLSLMTSLDTFHSSNRCSRSM